MRFALCLLIAILAASPARAGSLPEVCGQLFAGGFEDTAATPPTSVAGADQLALRGSEVTLDGSASSGTGPLGYCWELISRPAGSQAQLSDPQSVSPSFVADQVGDYLLRLTAFEGMLAGAADLVLVSTRGVAAEVPPAQGEQLVSADYALTMDVAAGALAAPTTVGVSLLADGDVPAVLAQAGADRVYELSPDGQNFGAPVDLSWRQPRGAEIVPRVLVHESGGMLDLADGVHQVDPGGELITGQVAHFSRIAPVIVPFLRLNIDRFLIVGVGQRFEIGYSATATGAPDGFSASTLKTGAYTNAPVLIGPATVPAVVGDLRYEEDLSILAPGVTSDDARFSGRCESPGSAQVAVQVRYSRLFAQFLPPLPPGPDPIVRLIANVRCINALQPPVARDDQINIGFSLLPTQHRITVLGNDFDPDGSLDPASVEIVTPPRFGSAVVQADGSILFTTNRLRLQERFSYRVRDNAGLYSNVANVELTRFVFFNQPPDAQDDQFSVPAEQTSVLDVLGNDLDSDGVLDPATVVISGGPSSGTAQIQADGSVAYTPNAGFVGADSFSYQVSDDLGAQSNPATVNIAVQSAAPPPTTQVDSAQTDIDVAVDIDVLANDSGFDPATLEARGPAASQVTVIQGASGNPLMRYTPAPGFVGTAGFLYRVANAQGQFSADTSVTVTVLNPNNQPPVAVDDQANVVRDSQVDIFVLLNDFDPDSLITAGSESVVQPPSNGVADSAAAGPGGIRYTPNPGFVGVDTFTYTVADAQGAVSNQATVTVTVLDQTTLPPQAVDDNLFLAPDRALRFFPLINDLRFDGNLLQGSLSIVAPPGSGSAQTMADGSILYVPNSGFTGIDALSYTVEDDIGGVSNVATATFNVGDFGGSGEFVFDNISAAEVNFYGIVGQDFQDQGTGGFFGFFHSDAAYQQAVEQIGDDTWLFGFPATTEQAAAPIYDMVTDLQSGLASYDFINSAFAITGFDPAPLFPASGGSFAVGPQGVGNVAQIAPPPPVIDGNGDPTVIRSDFQGLATVFGAADGSFTHLLARFAVLNQATGELQGLLARVPAAAMNLVGGIRQRELIDAQTRQMLAYRGLIPVSGVAIVFYNMTPTTTVFVGPGQRDVPIGAGRGISLPAVQLQTSPPACANFRVNTLCEGGPLEVLLAANSNGDVTVHSAQDGSLLYQLLGVGAPNFDILSGWEIAQDPRTNCLLFTDTSNDDVVRYNTDGSTVTSPFISLAGGSGGTVLDAPRSMAFVDGEVWVVSNTQGRVVRFDALDGSFLGEQVTGAGRPSGIVVESDRDVILTDDSFSSGNDQVYLYPADGTDRRLLIAGGLGTPYQISRLFDGNYALANFGGNQIQVFNDGAPQLAAVTIGVGPNGNYNPRGMQPLSNGNWLVSARNGGGVAVVDPSMTSSGFVQTIVPGSSFRSITRACFPQR